MFDNLCCFGVIIGKFGGNFVVREYGFVEFSEVICN